MLEILEDGLVMGRNSREAVLKKYNYMTSLKRLEHIFAMEQESRSHN
jgi:hypothetical protein